jgi:hypothetical protein
MESVLVTQAEAAGIFDHPDNIGDARELFVNQFLKNNLPPHLRLWTGEIIDHTVTPTNQERRHQVDVAVARDDVPVFLVGERSAALMPCEAVLATIEVKSQLTKQHAFGAFRAIQAWRAMERTAGSSIALVKAPPNRIINYVFAYAGPTVATLVTYMREFSEKNAVPLGNLFDACVVLNRGAIIVNDGAALEKQGEHTYLWLEQKQDNLLLLMASVFQAATGFLSTPPALNRYLAGRPLQPTQSGFVDGMEGLTFRFDTSQDV